MNGQAGQNGQVPANNVQRIENLGPAERLIQALLTYNDHLVHNRPGIVTPNPTSPVKAEWKFATFKMEGAEGAKVKTAYFIINNKRVLAGTFAADGKTIMNNGRVVGEYRQPGFFPEVALFMYRTVADIYKMDNEFVARWASYAFHQDHKDMKVVLCAFLLVQSRFGEPIVENGKYAFSDDDYRAIGEAMCLIRRKGGDFDPRMLLRVGELLELPEIAALNRELGFGLSTKRANMGRWPLAVERYLRHREDNPAVLKGAAEKFKGTIVKLCAKARYKPTSDRFFQILNWKQDQSGDGRRTMAIGVDVAKAETWDGLSEGEICEKIAKAKPKYNYTRIMNLVPIAIGPTRAIVACAVENGAMSEQEMIRYTATFEELGLLTVEPVKSRWEKALKNAENQRAVNVAKTVKQADTKEKLQVAADNAMKKAVAEVVKGMVLYVFVDTSSSMTAGIKTAIEYISKFLGGFPIEKMHVATFNTTGKAVVIKHASKAGVEATFRGITANGGTDYGSGIAALSAHKPAADEDVLFLFVGDNDPDNRGRSFADQVRRSGLNPLAMGLVFVSPNGQDGHVVDVTAAALGIPCIRIDEAVFADPYAIPRTLRNLIAATPVGKIAMPVAAPRVQRKTLVQEILETKLLEKPAWAA